MDFSWSYIDTVRRIVGDSGYRVFQVTDGDGYSPTSLAFTLDFSSGSCHIPIFCVNKALQWYESNDKKALEAVIPLSVTRHGRQCSGAETMLKHFVRFYNDSRIAQVFTPKGEVYYGTNGIILDKDFNPLLLTTVEVFPNGEDYRYGGITAHLHPRVFTDDASLLNKHLAKKGICCFLTQNLNTLGDPGSIKVEIDDCSKFLRKAIKPDLQKSFDTDIRKLLRDNIDEVLEQFTLDYSING